MQLKKKKTESAHDINAEARAILNSLSYLSLEADQSGLDDLCSVIQTIIDLFPQMKNQNDPDQKGELKKIIELIIKFKNASPEARQYFLSIAQGA